MKPVDPISNLINRLTNDEDHRQQLWVYYLNGNSPSTFVDYLERLIKYSVSETSLQARIYTVVSDTPSDRFYDLLSRLSPLEQSIVSLLALGLSIGEISAYKGISIIRIRQVISVIRDNSCWKELYGIEKEADR